MIKHIKRPKGDVWQVYSRRGGKKIYVGTFTSARTAKFVDASQRKATTTLRWARISGDVCVAALQDCAWVITLDHAAGRKQRFTLVSIHGSRLPKVTGRELTLAHCKRIANAEKEKVFG